MNWLGGLNGFRHHWNWPQVKIIECGLKQEWNELQNKVAPVSYFILWPSQIITWHVCRIAGSAVLSWFWRSRRSASCRPGQNRNRGGNSHIHSEKQKATSEWVKLKMSLDWLNLSNIAVSYCSGRFMCSLFCNIISELINSAIPQFSNLLSWDFIYCALIVRRRAWAWV